MRFRSRTYPALLALALLIPTMQACEGKGGGSDVTVDHSSAGNPPDLSTTLVPLPAGGGGDTDIDDNAPGAQSDSSQVAATSLG